MKMRSLLVIGAGLVAFSGLSEVTWKEAVDGLWSDESRWDGGSVPTAGDTVSLPVIAGANYVVTSATDTAVLSGLVVSKTGNVDENSRSATLLVTNSTLSISVAKTHALKLQRHGKIRVVKNGSLSISTTSAFSKGGEAVRLNYRGALLHVDGGTVSFGGATDHCGQISNGGDWTATVNQEPPEVRVSAGILDILSESIGYAGYGNSKFVMTGGKTHIKMSGSWDAAFFIQAEGAPLSLSGNSWLHVEQGRLRLGRGTMNVSGQAKISDSNAMILGDSNVANLGATLNLKENSCLDVGNAVFTQFSSGEYSGTVQPSYSRLNVLGGHHKFAHENFWGCGKHKATVVITNDSSVTIAQVGVSIGSPKWSETNFGASETGSYATGTVSVAGNAVFSVLGNSNNSDMARRFMSGFIVGNGTVSKDSGAWFYGSLDVSENAIVTNGLCPFVVGIGLGEGRVMQRGGTVYSTATYGMGSPTGGPTGVWEAKPMVVGALGGKGTYVMSGGTSTFMASAFVGGIESNRFMRSFRLPSAAYRTAHTEGILCVTGGTFKTEGKMFVGLDGKATVQAGGTGKIVTAGDFCIYRNGSDTVVKVSPRTDGAAPIWIGESLRVEDANARFEIDMSSVPDDEDGIFPLINCKSVSGEGFDPSNVKIVGTTEWRLVTRAVGTRKELCCKRRKGLLLMFR